MKYIDFKKFTDENGAQPIYLFEGEEVYFREKGEGMLKSRYLQEATLDYASFDGGALKGDKLKALIDAVNCFPFISEKRVVKVSEFYPTEKDYDFYLKSLFENPPSTTILLIVNVKSNFPTLITFTSAPAMILYTEWVDCISLQSGTVLSSLIAVDFRSFLLHL